MNLQKALRIAYSELGPTDARRETYSIMRALDKEFGVPKPTKLEVGKETVELMEVVGETLVKVFTVNDMVTPISIGNWDIYLSENKAYKVESIKNSCIFIIDDSGFSNPYLSNRFELNKN